MENQGHPRIEKTSRQLRIYFQNNGDRDEFQRKSFTHHIPIIICSSAHQSSLIIDSDEENWIFIDNKNLLERTVLHFQKTLANLYSFINLYHQGISKTDFFKFNIDKKVEKISRKKKANNNSHKKLIQKLKSSSYQSEAYILEERQELKALLKNLVEIETLPKSILSLSAFQGHHSCQILIHGRGNPSVDNYYYNTSGRSQSSRLPVTSFNSIFNLIHKSKNKIFNQSQILKSDLGVIGTFLAKEIDLKTYRVVFIISRDDFLPTTEREKNYFDEISNNLSPIIDFLLLKQDVERKERYLLQTLNIYPQPLVILGQEDEVIFHSECFKDKHQKELEAGGLHFETFPLSRNQKLLLYRQDTENISTDIHHFQRISLLGELLNTLQHELSNPLFGLKLTTELLKTESDNEEINETLDDILQNSSRCQTIIENFSYLYQDNKSYSKVNLKKLLQETSTLTKSETRGIRREIIYNDFSSEEDIYLEINPTWITQIVFNLVVNSAQAIKTISDNLNEHLISIHVDKISSTEICISISDTGPGISQDSLEKVFSPFYTTKSQGTGLGLSICRNLARKLGGDLTFKNNIPLPGATFSLNLPL